MLGVSPANHGSTALMMASMKGHGGIVEALLQAGADIDKADINGNTPLICASQDGHDGIVEALLQAGANE